MHASDDLGIAAHASRVFTRGLHVMRLPDRVAGDPPHYSTNPRVEVGADRAAAARGVEAGGGGGVHIIMHVCLHCMFVAGDAKCLSRHVTIRTVSHHHARMCAYMCA